MPSNRQRKRKRTSRGAGLSASPQGVAGAPSAVSPAGQAGGRSRKLVFAALCAICLLVSGGYVAWSIARDGAPAGQALGGPMDALGAPGSIARLSGSSGALMFQNVTSGDYWNRVGIVSLDHPDGERTMLPFHCLRVHYAAGQGLCLAEASRIPGTYAAYVFDRDMGVTHKIDLAGLPSRARVSPDGRFGAATDFVTGHSYSDGGLSTETLLIDLTTGDVIANLEKFTVFRDDEPYFDETFNFWGVTFTQDSNRFYVTLAIQGTAYLAEGDIARKQIHLLRENVECPSISPDNTRIAFKKKVGQDLQGTTWRLTVLDLATMTETPVAETRSIDDQVEWLDNSTLLYGNGSDTWMAAADGTGSPRRFLSSALSPVVIPASGVSVAASPAAGDQLPADEAKLTLTETDLDISLTAPSQPAHAGGALTYTVTVTNNGPHDATWLILDFYLPAGTENPAWASVSPPGINYGCGLYAEEEVGRIHCDTPTLAAGASWKLTFTVTPQAAGTTTTHVTISSSETDPNPDNDAARLDVTVAP